MPWMIIFYLALSSWEGIEWAAQHYKWVCPKSLALMLFWLLSLGAPFSGHHIEL